jgi:hypothetical protein
MAAAQIPGAQFHETGSDHASASEAAVLPTAAVCFALFCARQAVAGCLHQHPSMPPACR